MIAQLHKVVAMFRAGKNKGFQSLELLQKNQKYIYLMIAFLRLILKQM
jgi:hypothetical protein